MSRYTLMGFSVCCVNKKTADYDPNYVILLDSQSAHQAPGFVSSELNIKCNF